MIKILKVYLLSILLLVSYQSRLQAAPMNYKGSITSMTTISKNHSSVELGYAMTSKDSLGIKAHQIKGRGYQIKSGGIFHLRKLMRINAINSQTNLWLFTEAGRVSIKKNSKERENFYLSPKFQFDYETKRIYGLISHKFLRVGHDNFDTSKIEAGFSFYETSYKKIQPWLILKAKNTNSLFTKVEYTSTLRLINNAIFMDAGITTVGDPSIHLMYTF